MNLPPESLLEYAYQALKDRILHADYPAGSRLPVDRLSRELEISSTPIKGALNRLVAEHLVEQIPRCGYAVVQLSLKDLTEVLELRKMFEIFAIRPAIKNKHRFPEIITHIESLLEQNVDFIFYPCMSYNIDEGENDNHYNCPVVAYYPELLKANNPRLNKQNFRFPYMDLNQPKNVARVMQEALADYGITRKQTKAATEAAFAAQKQYREQVIA